MEWQDALARLNESLKLYGKSISVNDYEDDVCYTCEIRNRNGKVILYTDCPSEDELPETISKLYIHIRARML